jgi:hypothetical protein
MGNCYIAHKPSCVPACFICIDVLSDKFAFTTQPEQKCYVCSHISGKSIEHCVSEPISRQAYEAVISLERFREISCLSRKELTLPLWSKSVCSWGQEWRSRSTGYVGHELWKMMSTKDFRLDWNWCVIFSTQFRRKPDVATFTLKFFSWTLRDDKKNWLKTMSCKSWGSTAVTMTNAVLWDVTPCGCCKNILFEITYRLHKLGEKIDELGTLA